MKTSLEVLFAPAEFAALRQRDLSRTVCVVFDVLRATTSVVTALAAGAEAILPVGEIAEALAVRTGRPDALLAGERDGLRIRGELAGGVEFDLGNSPREFVAERVAGRRIIMTTTNGTRALQACAHAAAVRVGALVNVGAVAAWLQRTRPAEVLLVCSGTLDQLALEDAIAAGAVCDLLAPLNAAVDWSDSAQLARELFRSLGGDLPAALGRARNGRRLLGQPTLAADVEFCATRDRFTGVPERQADGWIRWA